MNAMDFLSLELKCCLLLVFAGLLTAVFRKISASQRHMVWSLAMLGCLLVPVICLGIPQWKLAVLPENTTPQHWVRPQTPMAVVEPVTSELPAVVDVAPAAPVEEGSRAAPKWSLWQWAGIVWGAGVLLVVLPLLVGHVAVQRLVRRSKPASGEWPGLIERLQQKMRIKGKVAVLEATGAQMPMALGLTRSRIVLPENGRDWSEQERVAVLAHELAHVKRRDCLIHFVSSLALALHWFNPLAWYAMRRMRLEREHACDDYVLRAGAEPDVYADHLLTIARTMPCRLPVLGAAITMARKNALEGRLLAILDGARNRKALSIGMIATALLLLVGIAAPLAAMTSASSPKPAPANMAGLTYSSMPIEGVPDTHRIIFLPADDDCTLLLSINRVQGGKTEQVDALLLPLKGRTSVTLTSSDDRLGLRLADGRNMGVSTADIKMRDGETSQINEGNCLVTKGGESALMGSKSIWEVYGSTEYLSEGVYRYGWPDEVLATSSKYPAIIYYNITMSYLPGIVTEMPAPRFGGTVTVNGKSADLDVGSLDLDAGTLKWTYLGPAKQKDAYQVIYRPASGRKGTTYTTVLFDGAKASSFLNGKAQAGKFFPLKPSRIAPRIVPPAKGLNFCVVMDEDEPGGVPLPLMHAQGQENDLRIDPKVHLSSADVKSASIESVGAHPRIMLDLTKEGAVKFEKLTEAIAGQRLAIVLNGQILTAPTVMQKISGGKAAITGSFEKNELNQLLAQLKACGIQVPEAPLPSDYCGVWVDADSGSFPVGIMLRSDGVLRIVALYTDTTGTWAYTTSGIILSTPEDESYSAQLINGQLVINDGGDLTKMKRVETPEEYRAWFDQAAPAAVIAVHKITKLEDDGTLIRWQLHLQERENLCYHSFWLLPQGQISDYWGSGPFVVEPASVSFSLEVKPKGAGLDYKMGYSREGFDMVTGRDEARPVPEHDQTRSLMLHHPEPLGDSYVPLWKRDFLKAGEVVMSLVYAVRLMADDASEMTDVTGMSAYYEKMLPVPDMGEIHADYPLKGWRICLVLEGAEEGGAVLPFMSQKNDETELRVDPEQALGSEVFDLCAISGDGKGVQMNLSDDGREAFAAFTEKHVGKRLAVVFNGKIIIAPRVKEKITTDSVNITGSNDPQELLNLLGEAGVTKDESPMDATLVCGQWAGERDGSGLTLTIKGDGSLFLAGSDGHNLDGSWEIRGQNIQLSGLGDEVATGVLDGDRLTITVGNESFIFTRVAFAKGTPLSVQAVGTWLSSVPEQLLLELKADGSLMAGEGGEQHREAAGTWDVRNNRIALSIPGEPTAEGELIGNKMLVRASGDVILFNRAVKSTPPKWSDADILGTWEVNEPEHMVLELQANGTAIGKNGATRIPGTWELSGDHIKFLFPGHFSATAQIVGDALVLSTDDGEVLPFHRPEKTASVKALAEADILGEWEALDRYAEPDGRMQLRVEQGGSALIYGLDTRMRARWSINVDELVLETRADGTMTADMNAQGYLVLRFGGKAIMEMKRPGAADSSIALPGPEVEVLPNSIEMSQERDRLLWERSRAARFKAVDGINASDERNEALSALALAAAGVHDTESALKAVKMINASDCMNSAADRCVTVYLNSGLLDDALRFANVINASDKKNAAMKRISLAVAAPVAQPVATSVVIRDDAQVVIYEQDPLQREHLLRGFDARIKAAKTMMMITDRDRALAAIACDAASYHEIEPTIRTLKDMTMISSRDEAAKQSAIPFIQCGYADEAIRIAETMTMISAKNEVLSMIANGCPAGASIEHVPLHNNETRISIEMHPDGVTQTGGMEMAPGMVEQADIMVEHADAMVEQVVPMMENMVPMMENMSGNMQGSTKDMQREMKKMQKEMRKAQKEMERAMRSMK